MFAFIRHLFIPHEDNGWKAKLLHPDLLTVVIAVFLFFNLLSRQAITTHMHKVLGAQIALSVTDLLENTNKERARYGLPALSVSPTLEKAAADKASDMFAKNYWAHYSPDGITPWYFFQKNGYSYDSAGENLAKDFTDSDQVIQAWMNSPKHRENILNDEYQEIGFAVREGTLLGQPTILVVQLFGKPEPGVVIANNDTSKTLPATTTKATRVQNQTISPLPVNPVNVQRLATMGFLIALFIVLSIDMYYMQHAGVFRITGKHIAHLTLILFLLCSALLVKQGFIL